MDGKEVYKFATREVPTVINEALDAADMSIEDVDWLLLHQVSIFTFNFSVLTPIAVKKDY
jgi:3-oxoacyl-[acyl-carrier-protein] synthase-3